MINYDIDFHPSTHRFYGSFHILKINFWPYSNLMPNAPFTPRHKAACNPTTTYVISIYRLSEVFHIYATPRNWYK